MNPRFATMAVVCREAALPALVLAWIATSGFAAIDHTGAAPVVDRLAPSLAADAKLTDKPQPTAPDSFNVALASLPATEAAATKTVITDTSPTPASHEPEPIVTAALTDPSEKLSSEAEQPEPPLEQLAYPGVASREPGDISRSAGGVDSIEILDECFVVEICVDRYLFALYQRAPKEDSVKNTEQRKVTVKRKGRLVTVTRTFTTRTDEDFSWKDPKAAERAGMSMADYVIGGMDRDFKLKLFYMLHAADEAGLSPGITSAFRDDYRQSIASGLKAASDRSYHGGSLRGGYGHGLAADIVSVNGATRGQRLTNTQVLWKWVDTRGKDFGIGRPYLDRDPPHVGPMDGKEYADKRGSPKPRQEAAAKPRSRIASNRIASREARAH